MSARETFRVGFHVRWGDMDFNAHMRNTAYLDVAADVRMMFFEQYGFSMREFERLRIGPVLLRDELTYHREMRLLERYEATLEMAALAPDGSRYRMRNDFFRADGALAARVTTDGGWLELDRRRLTAPPPELLAALVAAARSEDFEELRSNLAGDA